ncbi:DUF2785 domain-containing protein [Candidatus Bipolaricaulota bacterium]
MSKLRESPVSKETIQSIIESDLEVPAGVDPSDLLPGLLELLGSTDAYLRENSLEILWSWGHAGTFTDEQLIQIGEQTASNLAVGLGESGTDSVFLRAFSALILGMVLRLDQLCEMKLMEGRAAFLDAPHVRRWFDRALQSLEGENDLRGYTQACGWAHAVAHMGDALFYFSRSRHLAAPELQRMLDTIADRMIRPTDSIFAFDEDNRLMRSVYLALLRDEVSVEALSAWIERLAHTPEGEKWGSVFGLEHCDHRATNARMNARSFLRSLYLLILIGMRGSEDSQRDLKPYFELLDREVPQRDALLSIVLEAVMSMNRSLYRANPPT